jgi:hypothetical protein
LDSGALGLDLFQPQRGVSATDIFSSGDDRQRLYQVEIKLVGVFEAG